MAVAVAVGTPARRGRVRSTLASRIPLGILLSYRRIPPQVRRHFGSPATSGLALAEMQGGANGWVVLYNYGARAPFRNLIRNLILDPKHPAYALWFTDV